MELELKVVISIDLWLYSKKISLKLDVLNKNIKTNVFWAGLY